MLTSCQYCGKIHEKKYICDKKRKAQEERWKKKRETKAFRFRKSYEWTQKSREIRERDHYMCLCCQAGLEKTYKKFNTEELDVHHIIPIEEDFNLRLSDDNLITMMKQSEKHIAMVLKAAEALRLSSQNWQIPLSSGKKRILIRSLPEL